MASNNGEQERSQATPNHPVDPPRSEEQQPQSRDNLHRAIRTNIILAQGPQYNAPSPLRPPLYMNRQAYPHPSLAPANHAVAFAGPVGQQQTPAIQARSMLPPTLPPALPPHLRPTLRPPLRPTLRPTLPQARLAPHHQLNISAPPRFFPVPLDRLYNLFPPVQENHLQGNRNLSMAPPGFFGNDIWAIEQLRAMFGARNPVDQQALAQQAQLAQQAPDQHGQHDQAALAPEVPDAIPTWQIIYQVSPFAWGLAEVVQVLTAPFDPTQFMPTWEANRRGLTDLAVPGSLQNTQVCTVCSYGWKMVDRCIQCQVNYFEREGKLQGILWMIQVYGMWKERIAGEVLPAPEKAILLLEATTRLRWLNERQKYIWQESLRVAGEAELKHPWHCICQGGSMYQQGTVEEDQL